MKIVLLGPGLMGSQIACEYALGGHEVVVLARRPEVARERIERGFSTAREHGLATSEQVAAARERMTIEEDIDAANGARIIVESVVEDLVEKKEALLPVVARNPDAIVASNTSSIPITAIGAAIGAGERTVGAHYWNPPLLMPMVEVIRGDETAEDIVTEMTATLRALGKRPVLVDRDVAGFRLEPAPARAPAGGGLAGRERRRLSGDGRRDRAGRVGPALALHRTVSNRGPRRRGDVRAGGEPPLAGAFTGDLAPGPATVARRIAGDDGTTARAAGPRTGRRHASGPRA